MNPNMKQCLEDPLCRLLSGTKLETQLSHAFKLKKDNNQNTPKEMGGGGEGGRYQGSFHKVAHIAHHTLYHTAVSSRTVEENYRNTVLPLKAQKQ